MKIFLMSMLFSGAFYSANSFATCQGYEELRPSKNPCNDVIVYNEGKNEYPADKLKEDQARAAEAKVKVVDKDYLSEAKNSALDMLIKASNEYKKGTITKDQYIQIANQVSQMAEYANNNKTESKCVNTGLTGNCDKLVVSTPKK
ncbi:hypothetical protein SHI21_15115 [Bacteriovorax sp. PP10]|uniref:Uncharacterized protein n=1 Tax=Bacteriovorax antarcticus TaxID=3088717 RepID=A0ABU5VY79_9BACT|nr:hypothetical protein [Bacteriovorax sp. PP10]MEA9357557.1 hypothetical protein [Bacteriovorax sp. PP10]